MSGQASVNIDLDTLSDDIDDHTRVLQSPELRAITYRRVLPRYLELLQRHSIKGTFFVIGRDIEDHVDILRAIAADGHELANHTMTHAKQLVNLPDEAIAREIDECGRRLAAIAGRPTTGFRAPGYTISARVIGLLRKAGYTYDTSLNGSLIYSAIKRGFRGFKLQDQQYVTCQPWLDHFGPRNPYRPSRESLTRTDPAQSLIEIPVSVIPFVQYPFVTSVLLPMGVTPTLWSLDRLVAQRRFINCGVHINEFTDHGDLAGVDHSLYYTRRLMRISLHERMSYFDQLLGAIKRHCEIVLLRDVVA